MKKLIVTIIFPMFLFLLLHWLIFVIAYPTQITILKNHPEYQFNVWLPIDNMTYSNTTTKFFDWIYQCHRSAEILLPFLVLFCAGHKSFYTYLKCASICSIIGMIIALCFPVVDYLHEPWYTGPNSLVFRPDDFRYNEYNLICLPSFHVLIPAFSLFAMFFVKIDQRKINFKVWLPALIFILLFTILVMTSIVVTKAHYLADGLVSILICIVVYGLSWVVYKKKNGTKLMTISNKFYRYINRNSVWCYIGVLLICIFIILLWALTPLFDSLFRLVWAAN